jgi:ABC-2 type transport system ATP-binding protein
MAAIIQTENLFKRYGRLVALNNLTMNIEEGSCFGFIGPNGAGKTTTIRILATLLQPTSGEARICGYVVGYESRKIRPLIGYVPDFFGAYDDIVVLEYLQFFAAAYGIVGEHRNKVVRDVLELTDLGYKQDALVNSLSRGMQQRLSVARVLLHDPQVLLLDEPASGLDPRARIEMRELLKELWRMGKTVLISSHILHELAELCNTVGIIERGKLLYCGPVQQILHAGRTGTTVLIELTDPSRGEKAAKVLMDLPDVAEVSRQDGRLTVSLTREIKDFSFLAATLLNAGVPLRGLREEEVNLETAFMRLTQGIVQ